MNMLEFKIELTKLINRCSLENGLDMPDFIMADMVCYILNSLFQSHKENKAWRGIQDLPTQLPEPKEQL